MHELAIADSLVRIACAHARGRRIVRVEVQVGYLRQVVPDALAFAFELVAQGTEAEGADLALEEVPIVAYCRRCEAEEELAGFPLMCPACGGTDLKLLRGEELLVDALELEDEMAVTNGGTGHGD
jgi:hydrogenase nickel incorporation protein HypA/HybF